MHRDFFAILSVIGNAHIKKEDLQVDNCLIPLPQSNIWCYFVTDISVILLCSYHYSVESFSLALMGHHRQGCHGSYIFKGESDSKIEVAGG